MTMDRPSPVCWYYSRFAPAVQSSLAADADAGAPCWTARLTLHNQVPAIPGRLAHMQLPTSCGSRSLSESNDLFSRETRSFASHSTALPC